jgi:hypothetical protein
VNRVRVAALVCAFALGVSALLARPLAVFAGPLTADCVNELNPAFAGTVDAVAYNGYYSHLDPQTLFLCTNPDPGTPSASWGWSAVQATSGSCSQQDGCPRSIVQIGRGACRYSAYADCNGTAQRLWVAYGRDSGVTGCAGLQNIDPIPLDRAAAPTDTGLHYYRVWRDGSTWKFDHWPKGQAVVQVFSISSSLICWTQREGVSFSEIWDRGDGLGGSTANHYNYQSMTRLTQGGVWQATLNQPCGATGDPYFCDETGQQKWEAWTDR